MSTITTSYVPPIAPLTGRRLNTRGTIPAWHCRISRASRFFITTELALIAAGSLLALLMGAAMPDTTAVVAAAVLFAFSRVAFYVCGRRSLAVATGEQFAQTSAVALIVVMAPLIVVGFVHPALLPSRSIILGVLAGSVLTSVVLRAAARAAVRHQRFVEDCMIVGNGGKAERFFQELQAAQPGAVVPVPNGSADGSCVLELENLQRLADRGDFARIVVAEPALDRHPELYTVLLDCKMRGLAIEDAVDSYERLAGRIWVEGLRPEWVVYSDGFRRGAVQRIVKRSLDIAVALSVLALTVPLMLFIAIAIKLESAGPAVFAQERVGRQGTTFTLYKFRSMRQDAEVQSGPVWAGENDHRITPLGRILRKCRLDELPQVWNVLRGEMSFVGPRPERPYFVSLLREHIPFYDLRHYVAPGITGWAQVMYPYGASVEDSYRKLEYDLYYSKHMSLLFDLRVLIKTVQVVLLGRGAR
jgi:sugar transferase (PEP-CTERM system associated)